MLISFRYVEVEGEIHETPFQAFETVHAVNFPPPEQKRKPETVMSSLKDARAVVENGNPEGWGQVLDITPKFNKFGLVLTRVSRVRLPEHLVYLLL